MLDAGFSDGILGHGCIMLLEAHLKTVHATHGTHGRSAAACSCSHVLCCYYTRNGINAGNELRHGATRYQYTRYRHTVHWVKGTPLIGHLVHTGTMLYYYCRAHGSAEGVPSLAALLGYLSAWLGMAWHGSMQSAASMALQFRFCKPAEDR